MLQEEEGGASLWGAQHGASGGKGGHSLPAQCQLHPREGQGLVEEGSRVSSQEGESNGAQGLLGVSGGSRSPVRGGGCSENQSPLLLLCCIRAPGGSRCRACRWGSVRQMPPTAQ